MTSREEALSSFKDWYDGEKRGKGSVPKGTIAGALVVLDCIWPDLSRASDAWGRSN
jgi:hypothetical protein